MFCFGSRHLGERSGSGPIERESSREKESTHQIEEVRVVLGLVGFYRKFIPGFG